MAAVIGMDEGSLESVCQEATAQSVTNLPKDAHPGQGRVIIANFNAPGQIVISGERGALSVAMELAKARGAKRRLPLPVSGAFQSPVLQTPAAGLTQTLEHLEVYRCTRP